MRQEEILPSKVERGLLVFGDMPEFQAQDGTVISGRKAYREYCKRYGVTNPSDFKNQWEKQRTERERSRTPGAGYDSRRRIEHLVRNFDRLSRR